MEDIPKEWTSPFLLGRGLNVSSRAMYHVRLAGINIEDKIKAKREGINIADKIKAKREGGEWQDTEVGCNPRPPVHPGQAWNSMRWMKLEVKP